jgi:hypothetical protein
MFFKKSVIGEVGWDDMDWTNLAQGRDRWRALVNEAKSLRVSKKKCWEFVQ